MWYEGLHLQHTGQWIWWSWWQLQNPKCHAQPLLLPTNAFLHHQFQRDAWNKPFRRGKTFLALAGCLWHLLLSSEAATMLRLAHVEMMVSCRYHRLHQGDWHNLCYLSCIISCSEGLLTSQVVGFWQHAPEVNAMMFRHSHSYMVLRQGQNCCCKAWFNDQ